MLLEEGSAGCLVYLESVVLRDTLDSILEHLLSALLDRSHEQGFVPLKTELIHWVDLVQVIQHEEQDRSLFTT